MRQPRRLVRQLDVVRRRVRVARGVAMDENKSCRGATNSIPKTLGEANRGLGLATLIDERRVDEPVAAIEQDDSELLLRQMRHFRAQIRGDVGGPTKSGPADRRSQPNRLAASGQSGQEPPIFAQGPHQRAEVALVRVCAHAARCWPARPWRSKSHATGAEWRSRNRRSSRMRKISASAGSYSAWTCRASSSKGVRS